LAVFISGSGSGMAALLKHQSSGCHHQTALVLSNKPDVMGLKRAEEYNVPTIVVETPSLRPFLEACGGAKAVALHARRQAHEQMILDVLEQHEIELVVLSGYMRVLTPLFVREWKGRLLNIHPSLLPKYPGAHAHRDALADEATVTGCTVHLVDEGVDSGPILAQQEVNILPDDDENSLSERVKSIEHTLYPQTIDDLAAGRITLD
jgi:formyltetrahydrofolate-dependent phosphoribosylglycinamide formyltransferase